MSNANGPQKTIPVIISESGLYQFRLAPDAKGATADSHAPLSTPTPHSRVVAAEQRKRVLTCLDGSSLSESALPLSAFIAHALSAELTLVHVMAPPRGAAPVAFDVLDWEIARREAEQYLEQKRAELVTTAGIAADDLRTELTQGRPAARVLSLEHELLPELTVLCRRGAGGIITTPDLGATAQQVLGGAKGSVLLIPAGTTPSVPPKRIMVALDGSSRAESVFPMVQAMAGGVEDAEILLVHVVADPRASGVLSDPEDIKLAQTLASRLEASGAAYLSSLKDRLAPAMPHIKSHVVRSVDTRATLLETARNEHADMIVLAAHGITANTDHSFGSVAGHVLHHAAIPVLVVQDLPATAAGRERHEGWVAH